MLPQIPEMRTEGKTTDQIVTILVRQVNILTQQLQFALQNIDMAAVYTDQGYSLEELYAAGALKGDPGVQGPPGRVWRPTVSGEGIISWTLTDEGGSTPAPQNIKGPEGDEGPQGEAGPGVPAGGVTGQVLRKKSDSDYDTEWVTL